MMYLTFFFSITLFLYGLYVFQADRKERVKRRITTILKNEKKETKIVEQPNDQEKQIPLVKRMLVPIWREFKRSFKKKMPGDKEEKLDLKLLRAGNPFGMTPFEYRLLQVSFLFLFPFFSWAYANLLNSNTAATFLLILLGFGSALILPSYYLKLKTKARHKKALLELPDVLDLLTVSLEAGLGFDSALSKVVSKKAGVLSTEFHRCLEEIRLGKTRREALRGIRDRLSVDEIKVLISSILQAEKLGVGMVQVLKVQSHEVREQRKHRAEEEAMKAPIKMLFPLVIFIFPSLFIVLLGPAVIQFLSTFTK
jgi:tight adherence protein C